MTDEHQPVELHREDASLDSRAGGVAPLHSLTPKYEAERHRVYFDAIEAALGWTGDEAVRNIALTGSYGVGKSSILRAVAKKHKKTVIEISLSTLGFEDSDNPAARGEDTKTNRIQKEIVKQLLYTQDPSAMPGSRYRRTTGFRPWRELLVSVLAAVPITLIFFLLGWTSKLAALFLVPADWRPIGNAGVLLLAAAFVLGVRWMLHNKIRIDSISAGAATIKLSEESATYFDEYLDEIVYFFEVTKGDIVIFEDIDRFEDAHIFETLRALNTLLNGAKQLEDHPVRFIYAIKDSIFEDIGTRAAREESTNQADESADNDAAVLEVARANRTKFFDLVIPVVPFITHQTARERLESELGTLQHQVSSDLIDLAAQHVADMRLIKNIRNEFVIFREQVIAKSTLELNDDALFAMVLYKSTHLSDFEFIKLGRSNLDVLYKESREIVRTNTARLRLEIQRATRKLSSETVGDEKARELGDKLDQVVTQVLALGNVSKVGQRYAGAEISSTELRSPTFWRSYAADGGPLELRYRDRYYNNVQMSALSEGMLTEILGERVVGAAWDERSRERLEQGIADGRVNIEFLAHADMSDLITRDDFTLQRGETALPFSTLVNRRLNSRLARSLLEAGYINRYFTLYTATFVGEWVSANAMNFILKVVDAGEVDTLFSLTPADVRAVLKERRQSLFRERAAYNLDVVDYLLREDEDGAVLVADKLARAGEPETTFLKVRLSSERDSAALLRMLAPRWSGLLRFLIERSGLEAGPLAYALNAALSALNPGLDYGGGEVGRYMRAHVGELNIFTSDATKAPVAANLAKVLTDSDVGLAALLPLGRSVRLAVVEAEAFDVTRENLQTALGGDEASIALDHLRSDSPHTYSRVLGDLEGYLQLLRDNEVTVASVEETSVVLEDVLEHARALVSAVVQRAAAECRIEDLRSISTGVWPALASDTRFPASFANVTAYTVEFGIDKSLAAVLQSGVINTGADIEDGAKSAVVEALLRSVDVLPSADVRARLLGSLRLSDYLPAESVPPEPGEWVGRLIEHQVIADDPESFTLIPADDWLGLTFAIGVSKEFVSFMSPAQLPPSKIVRLMSAGAVPEAVQDGVARRFTEFAAGADRVGLEAIANHAIRSGITLSFADIAQLAVGRVGESLVLEALRPVVANATLADLAPIMNALGENYYVLGTPSAKRPKLPISAATTALLERFRALGRVNKFVEERGHYRVYLNQR